MAKMSFKHTRLKNAPRHEPVYIEKEIVKEVEKLVHVPVEIIKEIEREIEKFKIPMWAFGIMAAEAAVIIALLLK